MIRPGFWLTFGPFILHTTYVYNHIILVYRCYYYSVLALNNIMGLQTKLLQYYLYGTMKANPLCLFDIISII